MELLWKNDSIFVLFLSIDEYIIFFFCLYMSITWNLGQRKIWDFLCFWILISLQLGQICPTFSWIMWHTCHVKCYICCRNCFLIVWCSGNLNLDSWIEYIASWRRWAGLGWWKCISRNLFGSSCSHGWKGILSYHLIA